MYADINFRTEKELAEAVGDGRRVTVYQPGPFGGQAPTNGEVSLEGPHYPEAHRWYARVTLADGVIFKVDGKVPKPSVKCGVCGERMTKSHLPGINGMQLCRNEAPKPKAPRKAGRGRIAFGCENIAHWCSGCPAGCFA